MGTIVGEFNRFLQYIFDIDDALYHKLICDNTGTPNEINPVNPIDMDIGCIADVLEWNRRLSKSLLTQIFLDQSTGIYLDLIAQIHLGIYRAQGESDADFKTRITDIILGHKVSPASIIYYMRPYSTEEPEVYEGYQNAAYANLSYAGCYTDYLIESGVEALIGTYVFPAIAMQLEGDAFHFTLYLVETPVGKIPTIIDTLNRMIAAGVTYDIKIRYA